MDASETSKSVKSEEKTTTYEYHYTGGQQPQIGGDGPIVGSTWSTAHDDPRVPGYISLGPGPLGNCRDLPV